MRANSLVLYKSRPARVVKTSDKLEIELDDGTTRRVRPKDVALLHPGPVGSPAALALHEAEVDSAWELLAGATTTLGELAELMFGEYTPESAWSAWQTVAEGLYFDGTPEHITARSAEEIAAERAARDARAAEAEAWAGFVQRLQQGQLLPEDAGRLGDVEALARGQTAASRVLRALGQRETPEKAHALLLRTGHWDENVNPHPARVGVPTRAPALDLPPLPDEPRVDLTHLAALAIDDEDNTDPDDAISVDADRVWVHVADVAALVQPDSDVDVEARARGATLYLPERTVPMLPPSAVERLALGMAETSPALSFAFTVKEGVISDIEVAPSWVRVTRLSYERAQCMLSQPPLAALRVLANDFRERRRARGAAFIELPEAKIRVHQDQIVIRPLLRLESRTVVTECMLMAGEAAARFALDNEIAFPFSTQPPPEVSAQPSDPAGMFAHRKRLRASEMKSAPEPHAGLGLELYSQVTSPLRRYLDLITHQQLRARLRGAMALPGPDVLTRIGAAQAVTGAVRRAERFSNRHWTLAYLKRHPQWTGTGIVLERRGQRATLIVPDLGLETEVHASPAVALNAEIDLRVAKVDLAALSARFRTVP